MNHIIRTERGWAGHFICSHRCRFRRNTLLECGETRIVVSTVGLMENPLEDKKKEPFMEIGYQRYYETMVFRAQWIDDRYWDADVLRQVSFTSPWSISKIDADDQANDMHEAVVTELTERLANGETFPNKEE